MIFVYDTMLSRENLCQYILGNILSHDFLYINMACLEAVQQQWDATFFPLIF
jgi:hypothetical protein